MENEDLKQKLDLIAFLDKCRWESKANNYYTVNYSERKNINNIDDKRLIHWLTYITDRGMPFEQIWDVGGYVFSELVYEYKYGKDKGNLEKLLEIKDKDDKEKNESFFIIDERKGKDGYSFASKYPTEKKCKDKIKYYTNNIFNEKLYFKPRYYPNDYISIYRTLYILKILSNKSFSEYIEKVLELASKEKKLNPKDTVNALANGLYFLTYKDGKEKGKLSMKKYYIQCCNYSEMFKDDKETLEEILQHYIKEEEMTSSAKKYTNKRLWCALRDYIKSNEFLEEMKKNLKNKAICINDNEMNEFIKEMKSYLELPGDVWNNNTKFRECLFPKSKINKFNEFLRKMKDTDMGSEWYPEQFDVTFNLASNLCSNNKCELCPFSMLKSKINEIESLCIGDKNGDENKYCPVIMRCCGYKVKCNQNDSDEIDVKCNSNSCVIKRIIEDSKNK